MSTNSYEPLASILRPDTLDDYVGQQHLVGQGGTIQKMLEQQACYSMIFWGPPGTGKTSLVQVIAKQLDADVIELSAISAGVKDIRNAIGNPDDKSLFDRQKVVFVDEIHRFNKSQQDAFLPFVESGHIILIGATTENPSFSVNRALLSRMRVFILEKLTQQELQVLLNKALKHTEKTNKQGYTFDAKAEQALLFHSNGDARTLLMSAEICFDMAEPGKKIDIDIVQKATGSKTLAFDKDGDHYYDLLSAFHKSIRGSSVEGGMYWFARLLKSGGDPLVIARRLLAIASEDIGNADPRALQICLNSWDLYHRVGPSEGERALAQAVIYCALAPKSNAVYKAFKAASALASETGHLEVPSHLRNAPSALAKEMGHGANYRYAHNEAHAYAAGESYLPSEISDVTFYEPSERGLEKQLKAKLAFLKSLDDNAN
ncbi:replication-associated recombination protein A [Glaciecola sp. MH2013]|uniref:replication-associated recombination protein A n=1 Tax=Glaciecola sp. MH2013 TaxID=2785524 RepID=UPI00189FE5E5|nr:replication-associated recombination protein A [Glaciecola sp. MH2013]MBF7072851.1 replication-associated recombination protein A [Glaciecola sp. MH2013]